MIDLQSTRDKIIYGTDPEFFLLDDAAKPVSAHRFLGTKDKPLIVTNKKNEVIGKVFRDGYVPEANTRPHVEILGVCKDMIRTMTKFELTLPDDINIHTMAARAVTNAELDAAPTDVKKFGCNPSTNAYTKESSVPEVDGETHTIRYAGGHLHFSTNLESEKYACLTDDTKHSDLVKIMDWLMGMPATYIWNDPYQFMRRANYGRAGEYRAQMYEDVKIKNHSDTEICVGVEYRTLPPAIWNNWKLAVFFMSIGKYIIENFDELLKIYPTAQEKNIQKAINTGKNIMIMTATLPIIPELYNLEILKKIKENRRTHIYGLSSTGVI